MHRRALGIALGLAMVSTGGQMALAQSRRCSDLPSQYQARCKQRVASECAQVTGYWPKRRCEDKVVGTMNPCTAPNVVKACTELRDAHQRICAAASDPTGDKFEAAASAYAGLHRWFRVIRPALKDCPRRRFGSCYLGTAFHDCVAVKASARTRWAGHIKWFTSSKLSIMNGHLSGFMRSGAYLDAAATCRTSIVEIDKILKKNNHPWLGMDVRPIVAARASFVRQLATMEARARAQLAKRRCPKAKGASKKWLGKLKKLNREYFAKPRTHWKKEIVHRFGLDGPITRTYSGAFRQFTHEHQLGIACIKRVHADKPPHCYSIYVYFIRSRHVQERRWGEWRIRRFSHNREILCKNMR